MPPPALVPALSFDAEGNPISNISFGLDATIIRGWRDGSECGVTDPKYPYYAFELQIAGWHPSSDRVLARYCGGKLKRNALYQLKGRFFVDMSSSKEGKSYFHIDDAVRFQGPGVIKSFRMPQFLVVGEVMSVCGTHVVVRWDTSDPYRRGLVYEQSAVLSLERPLEKEERFVGHLCGVEGRMDGLDHKKDWACVGIEIC